MSDCGKKISSEGEVSQQQAEEILQRIRNMAAQRMAAGESSANAMKAVTDALQRHEELNSSMNLRAAAMSRQSIDGMKDFFRRFKKPGDGIMALLEGRNRNIPGARNSVDYQVKAINNQYFGRVIAELESADVLRPFVRNELNREIYIESGELNKPDGKPGISGSQDAAKIAQILDDVTGEMIARQNRAGAYIRSTGGAVARQTHDMDLIRAEGRTDEGKTSKALSYQRWRDFTLPLLDRNVTFIGKDPELWMREMHDTVYSGQQGMMRGQGTNQGWGIRQVTPDFEPTLHFRDAESAYKYNEKFGTRDLRDQVISDIRSRARSIGMMETLGPTPKQNLATAIDEYTKELQGHENAADLLESINPTKIGASFRQLTGENSIPSNPSLARTIGNVKILAQMAKMGGVFLSKLFGDKAFLQAEMAHQGISNLTTLGAQITGLARRTGDEKRTLHLMGIGLDGMMGNALSRYSDMSTMSGILDKAQKKFFDINFLNYWTDIHKMTAGDIMSHHLGGYANKEWADIPDDLRRVLSLYDIGDKHWDAIRSTAEGGQIGANLSKVSDDLLKPLVESNGLLENPESYARMRDKLETQLRTYFADRIDMAVPTPGASERRLTQLDTRAGTPLGETIRLMMLFKSFPITIANKILTRDLYGRGANSISEWALNDHRGKFNMATMIAMATASGYISSVLRDAMNGKTPEPLVSDGQINYHALADSAIKGGGLGIMGDIVVHDYDRHSSSFLEQMGGPVVGQADTLARAATKMKHGEDVTREIGKMTLDNTPLINLFYVRPVLNYYVLWNLEQMMNPDKIRNMQRSAERDHQQYFMGPAAR